MAIRLPDVALADDDWEGRFERMVRLADRSSVQRVWVAGEQVAGPDAT